MGVEAGQFALAEQVENPELMRVEHFQQTLEMVEQTTVVETSMYLDTPTPIQDATRSFLQFDQKTTPALYLSRENEAFTEAGRPTFVPRVSRSGKRSAHGVFFGDLLFEDGSAIPVAVKPHEVDAPEQSCATDYFSNEAASELGLETLESVGMILAPGRAYSMSRLVPTLDTLDSVDWETAAETQHTENDIMTVWDQVARQTAMLHAYGNVSHGDLAARNIAITPDSSGIFFIDWEKAEVSTLPPRDEEVSYAHSSTDMISLMESMALPRTHFKGGIDVLKGYEDKWQGFSELVFDEYVQTRIGFARTPRDVIQIRSELRELENTLKSHLDLVLSQA